MKEEEKLIEVYRHHVGLNAEWQYIPTPREWVLNAMRDYAEQQNKKLLDLLLQVNCYNNCGIALVDDDNNCDWCKRRNQILKTNTE